MCRYFLPRDAMRKRGLCYRPVSVRLSVTLVDCIQTAEDIVKLIPRPGILIILVFFLHRTPVRYPVPRGSHSAGAQMTCGWENFCDFRLKSQFISETVRYRPMVGTLIGNHRWRIDTCRFRWPWVTLNPGFKVTV